MYNAPEYKECPSCNTAFRGGYGLRHVNAPGKLFCSIKCLQDYNKLLYKGFLQ